MYELIDWWYWIRFDAPGAPDWCVWCGNHETTIFEQRMWIGKNPNSREYRVHPVLNCKKCRKQFSMVTKTRFAGTKIPMTGWLKAIHLIERYNMTINDLKEILEVSYKSAWKVKIKCIDVVKTGDILKYTGHPGVA